jgi:hypothetical protein
VDRPQALKFEDDGGILPVHSVGIEVSGRFPMSGWDLDYVGNLANGRGPIPDAVQGVSDLNRQKALALKLSLTRSGARSVSLGPSIYHDLIPAEPTVPGREGEIRELIPGAHFVYRDPAVELIAEATRVHHEDRVSGLVFDHLAGYAVAGITLGDWTPYAGVDQIDFDPGDLFFAGMDTDLTRVLAGVRYAVSHANTIKVEYRHDDRPTGAIHVFAVQSAFAF